MRGYLLWNQLDSLGRWSKHERHLLLLILKSRLRCYHIEFCTLICHLRDLILRQRSGVGLSIIWPGTRSQRMLRFDFNNASPSVCQILRCRIKHLGIEDGGSVCQMSFRLDIILGILSRIGHIINRCRTSHENLLLALTICALRIGSGWNLAIWWGLSLCCRLISF